jgi:hypothetical protein
MHRTAQGRQPDRVLFGELRRVLGNFCGSLGLFKELLGRFIRHDGFLRRDDQDAATTAWFALYLETGCTTAPSRVRFVAWTSSSSHFTARALVCLSTSEQYVTERRASEKPVTYC